MIDFSNSDWLHFQSRSGLVGSEQFIEIWFTDANEGKTRSLCAMSSLIKYRKRKKQKLTNTYKYSLDSNLASTQFLRVSFKRCWYLRSKSYYMGMGRVNMRVGVESGLGYWVLLFYIVSSVPILVWWCLSTICIGSIIKKKS